MSIADGGQLLISEATERLLGDGSDPAFDLVDMGEHRLRDLVQVLAACFQILRARAETDFPPLRSMGHVPRQPAGPLTTFVGRQGAGRDRRHVEQLPARHVDRRRRGRQDAAGVAGRRRGAAGVPRRRLAVRARGGERRRAHVPGCRRRGGRAPTRGMSMGESIVEFLRDREVLVVLDNCEHLLVDAARLASKMLQRAPKRADPRYQPRGSGGDRRAARRVSPLPVPRSADAATAAHPSPCGSSSTGR